MGFKLQVHDLRIGIRPVVLPVGADKAGKVIGRPQVCAAGTRPVRRIGDVGDKIHPDIGGTQQGAEAAGDKPRRGIQGHDLKRPPVVLPIGMLDPQGGAQVVCHVPLQGPAQGVFIGFRQVVAGGFVKYITFRIPVTHCQARAQRVGQRAGHKTFQLIILVFIQGYLGAPADFNFFRGPVAVHGDGAGDGAPAEQHALGSAHYFNGAHVQERQARQRCPAGIDTVPENAHGLLKTLVAAAADAPDGDVVVNLSLGNVDAGNNAGEILQAVGADGLNVLVRHYADGNGHVLQGFVAHGGGDDYLLQHGAVLRRYRDRGKHDCTCDYGKNASYHSVIN